MEATFSPGCWGRSRGSHTNRNLRAGVGTGGPMIPSVYTDVCMCVGERTSVPLLPDRQKNLIKPPPEEKRQFFFLV